jgi:hypothetical protein
MATGGHDNEDFSDVEKSCSLEEPGGSVVCMLPNVQKSTTLSILVIASLLCIPASVVSNQVLISRQLD